MNNYRFLCLQRQHFTLTLKWVLLDPQLFVDSFCHAGITKSVDLYLVIPVCSLSFLLHVIFSSCLEHFPFPLILRTWKLHVEANWFMIPVVGIYLASLNYGLSVFSNFTIFPLLFIQILWLLSPFHSVILASHICGPKSLPDKSLFLSIVNGQLVLVGYNFDWFFLP